MNSKNNSKVKTTLTKNQIAKQKCVDRISNFLLKKYGNLFKDKAYSNRQLFDDLSSNLKDKEVQSFNANTSLVKYEKLILEKVAKCESKHSIGLEMDQIKDLLPKQKTIDSPSSPTRQKSSPHSQANPIKNSLDPRPKANEEDSLIPYAREKIAALRQKENDEWAIKAKKEHQQFLIDEQDKRKSLEEGKRKQKEMLEQQIKEKEIQRQKEKKDEYDLYVKNNAYQPFRNEDNSRLNQIKAQQPRINSANKAKIKTEQQLSDDKYYELLKKDIINAENMEKEKKKRQREMNIQIQKDNEMNSKLKRQMMEQEKEIQKDFISKGKDPFTEDCKDNKHQGQLAIKQVGDTEAPLQKKEKCLQDYEKKKLQREMNEKEALEKQKEDDQCLKRKRLVEEFKQGLNDQVKEKKIIKQAKESTKQKDRVDSNKMNELYHKDIKKNNQDKIDKVAQYKHQLDQQIINKETKA